MLVNVDAVACSSSNSGGLGSGSTIPSEPMRMVHSEPVSGVRPGLLWGSINSTEQVIDEVVEVVG